MALRPKRHDDWTVVPEPLGALNRPPWGAEIGRPERSDQATATPGSRRPQATRTRQPRFPSPALLVATAQADAAKKDVKDAAKQKKSPEILDAMARKAAQIEKPSEPVPRRYSTSDTSVEKLGELLRDNPNGIGVVRDELVGWLRSLDKDGRENDLTFYLEAWGGNALSFTYDRIGRGTIFIPNPCVSILGGIQPGPLRSWLRRTASRRRRTTMV